MARKRVVPIPHAKPGEPQWRVITPGSKQLIMQATDRTALRERLIAAIEAARHRFQALGNEVFAYTFDDWIADAILAEFPEIGQQQPKHDWPVGEHGHKFSGSEPPRQQPRLDPALREQVTRTVSQAIDNWTVRRRKLQNYFYPDLAGLHKELITTLLATIAPAAQPLWNGSKDRVELFARRYASAYYDFKIGSPDSVVTGDFVDRKLTELLNLIAHAAQPLPTRSQLQELIDKRSWDSGFPSVPAGYLLRDMIAAGYAIEDPEDDEPEPQAEEVDFEAMSDGEVEAWLDKYCQIPGYSGWQVRRKNNSQWEGYGRGHNDFYPDLGNTYAEAIRALAKAVQDRGGS